MVPEWAGAYRADHANHRSLPPQLADSGWIYVVVDPDRAGNGLLTLLVDDLEAHVAALADRGIVTGPIETIPGVVSKAVIADPEGNRITFGQGLGSGG